MRNSFNIIFLFATTSLMISCGKSTDDGSNTTRAVSEPKKSVAVSEAAGGNTCLLGYADKLDQLLTLELASEMSGMPADKSEKKYFDKMKNTANHDVAYSWKNGRTRNMKDVGMDMVLPVKDIIKLDGIKSKTLKDFKMAHTAVTDDQLRQVDKKVDEAFEKKSGNAEINEKVDKLDKMNVSRNTQKSIAGTMTSAFAKVTQAYSDVSGVGDVASWNSFENKLYVLDKGVEVGITVDLGEDTNFNKKQAIKLATRLLEKCE